MEIISIFFSSEGNWRIGRERERERERYRVAGVEVGQFMRERDWIGACLNANAGRLCAGAGCRSVNTPRLRMHRTLKCCAKILHKRFHKFGPCPPSSLFETRQKETFIRHSRELGEAILDAYTKLTCIVNIKPMTLIFSNTYFLSKPSNLIVLISSLYIIIYNFRY